MKFSSPLVHGYLIKRYKRFLADIRLDNGATVTAHCTNSGTMKSCLEDNAEVYLSHNPNPKRKTQYTWEMIKINGNWVGINTLIPNKLAVELMKANKLPGLNGYSTIRPETTYGDSRFDVYAENSHERCFVEVKNVTMKVGSCALFPDAVTERGRKHLAALARAKHEGYRAVMLYIIQRTDVHCFGPARSIDPLYAQTLIEAHAQGVEIIALQVQVSPEGIAPLGVLPFQPNGE